MSSTLLEDIEVTESFDPILDKSIRYIRWFLWGNRIHKEEQMVYIPQGWWQYFKEQVFPTWLKRYFPVKKERIVCTTNYNHLCPHLNFSKPDDVKVHIAFLSTSEEIISV